VKYGTYSGTAEFTVWMPELPVILDIPDTQLGLVEGWRVPERSDNVFIFIFRQKFSVF